MVATHLLDGQVYRNPACHTAGQSADVWQRSYISERVFLFFLRSRRKGEGGGGPPIMQRSPKQNSSNSIRRKQQVPRGGGGGSPRLRYESGFLFIFSLFPNLTFLLENLKSTLLSKT